MLPLRQSHPQPSLSIPHITEVDLCLFHDTHFSEAVAIAFTADFLNPDKVERGPETQQHREGGDETHYEGDEDEDGLGYYPDGVKRTLTDEQIAMFRHSETQALQRERERASTRRIPSSPPTHAHIEALNGRRSGDGELSDDVSKVSIHAAKKKRNKKRKRGSGNGKRYYSPDPERRKRTWDVVETGLDGLDYGESGQAQEQVSPARQRRKVTYDDG